MHSQTIVDDCQRISRRPHLAGANEMITAVAILAGEAKPFVVSLQIVSGVVPRGICGVPVWWFSASRTVTSSLPLRPNSGQRSEEHTSELQSLMRISYAVFCLKNKQTHIT